MVMLAGLSPLTLATRWPAASIAAWELVAL